MKRSDEQEYQYSRKERIKIRIRREKKPSVKGVLMQIAALFFIVYLGAAVNGISTRYAQQNSENLADCKLVADFSGDVMMGRGIDKLAKTAGYNYIFSGVCDYWKRADIVGVNLESAVTDKNLKRHKVRGKEISLKIKTEKVDVLADAGVNLFACANNHMYDYGEEAVADLCDYMGENDRCYSGIGKNLEEMKPYTVIKKNGIKLGMLSCTSVFYPPYKVRTDRAGLITNEWEDLLEQVNAMSEEVDFSVVYTHWGAENDIQENDDQIKFAHHLIDAGADLVIGSHPHALQHAEKYGDGLIFYSLGNFIFDQGGSFNKDTAMVQLEILSDGTCQCEVIPMRMWNGCPFSADLLFSKRINRQIAEHMDKEDYYLNSYGHIMIPMDVVIQK